MSNLEPRLRLSSDNISSWRGLVWMKETVQLGMVFETGVSTWILTSFVPLAASICVAFADTSTLCLDDVFEASDPRERALKLLASSLTESTLFGSCFALVDLKREELSGLELWGLCLTVSTTVYSADSGLVSQYFVETGSLLPKPTATFRLIKWFLARAWRC